VRLGPPLEAHIRCRVCSLHAAEGTHADIEHASFPPLLYNVLQLTLTVYECSRGRWRRAVLPTLLLRDGVWAFMLIFGAPVRIVSPFPPPHDHGQPCTRPRESCSSRSGSRFPPYYGRESAAPLAARYSRTHSWGPAASSFAACRLVLRTHQEGAAQRAPVPAESAGFALTTIEPGVISSDDASQW
jgi:hypothetical protein